MKRSASYERATSYDHLYAAQDNSLLWGTRPGRLVANLRSYVRGAGSALDAGCGDGKNAHRLEELGWQVTGFDSSSLALRALAMRMPDRKGSYIERDLADYLAEGHARFDLIVSYGLFHCLDPVGRVDLHRALQDRVLPGGTILFSTLTDHLSWPSGHGTANLTLASEQEVEALLDGFECRFREDAEIREHHRPVIGWHSHSVHWSVLRRPI